MNIEKWIDVPSLIIGTLLVIFSLAYWDVLIAGSPAPKFTFGAGVFLILMKPVITVLTESDLEAEHGN